MTEKKDIEIGLPDINEEEKYWEEQFNKAEWKKALKEGYTNTDYESWKRIKTIYARESMTKNGSDKS
ncbi:hypothetical protein LCGC14_1642240 [marine sediment metagenome]|uniref:Uncharacterized protein n=1 Tax=marine sediment metagenome TaxID=412755 RepID=A0A0F9HZ68_9ZZZZ